MCAVDDPYSLEQLRDPRLNVSVVRPLVDRLYDLNDLSVGMLCFVELSLIDPNQEEGGCIPERRDAHSDRTVMSIICYSSSSRPHMLILCYLLTADGY
jgi:hypothetical protein